MVSKLISTGTAAFCVFDLEAMTHRLADSCDWWSVERDELAEINAGNCLIFGTGYDGGFDFDITQGRGLASPDVEVVIRAPSGRIYVGAGEDISGEDDQPEENSEYYRGLFLNVERGNYVVTVKRTGATIGVGLERTNREAVNHVAQQLRLADDA
ncbi:MAG: DUF6386 family protein [Gammaproteobacteria bacterium]|nr:DUF6386 family protein [Gammaproteobacteria bacterium]